MNDFNNLKIIFAGDISESWVVKLTTDEPDAIRPFVAQYAESRKYACDTEPGDYFYSIDFISVRRIRVDGSVGEIVMSYYLDKPTGSWGWENLC